MNSIMLKNAAITARKKSLPICKKMACYVGFETISNSDLRKDLVKLLSKQQRYIDEIKEQIEKLEIMWKQEETSLEKTALRDEIFLLQKEIRDIKLHGLPNKKQVKSIGNK